MISSTPFKILSNHSDENDSSVMKQSYKGAKTGDFSRKGGLSSFPSTTKASGTNGLSGASTSMRKPLLDLSKGQLNSRLSNTSTKPQNSLKGTSSVSKPIKLAFDIPITIKKAPSVSVKPRPKPLQSHDNTVIYLISRYISFLSLLFCVP